MSYFPPPIWTLSEIQRCNDYRNQALEQFLQIALPLSCRIIDVKLKMRSLRLRRPYNAVQNHLENACNTFDRCIVYFTTRLFNPAYIIRGDEVSRAKTDLNLWATRAERSLEMLQNRSRVRRKLTY